MKWLISSWGGGIPGCPPFVYIPKREAGVSWKIGEEIMEEEKSKYLRGGGGTIPKTNEIVKNICSCHNFPPLSSVQIIIIPACCLLCVL